MYLRLVVYFTFLMISCNGFSAEEDQPSVSKQFFSTRLIEQQSLADLVILDPGHPKTLLEFEKFPVNEEISLSVKRPTLNAEGGYEEKAKFSIRSDRTIMVQGRSTSKAYCISSRGFLPGERVLLRFQTKKGFQHDVSLIPNPMRAESAAQDLVLEAELTSVLPSVYKITLGGLNQDEEFLVLSSSLDESIQKGMKVTGEGPVEISVSPHLQNKRGGVGEVVVTRQVGSKAKLQLPWGESLLTYNVGNTVYNPFQ